MLLAGVVAAREKHKNIANLLQPRGHLRVALRRRRRRETQEHGCQAAQKAVVNQQVAKLVGHLNDVDKGH